MNIRFAKDELRFFKRNGFVVKRQVLDPSLMAKAREVFWERAPAQLQRDVPASWIGPFQEEYHFDDGTDRIRDFRWNLRHVGKEEWMVNLMVRNTNLTGMAEQLLGKGNLVLPGRVRGIYATLPQAGEGGLENHLHVDRGLFHLGMVTYLNQVVTGGGGFRVWPASHLWFHEGQSTHRYPELIAFFNTQPSLEFTGDAGDVVFFHRRIVHMADPNTSSTIRMAILYDFRIADFDYTQQESLHEDMWRDWPGLQVLP